MLSQDPGQWKMTVMCDVCCEKFKARVSNCFLDMAGVLQVVYATCPKCGADHLLLDSQIPSFVFEWLVKQV